MPRKSQAALSVVAVLDDRRERIPPPSHLPAPVGAIFAAVVASVAPNHFRACDTPLIEQLAVAISTARSAAAAIEREGIVIGGRANPSFQILERSTRLIATLSTRLRICPSGRLDRKTAGGTTRTRQPRPIDAGVIDELLALEDRT